MGNRITRALSAENDSASSLCSPPDMAVSPDRNAAFDPIGDTAAVKTPANA
jgi:hypothetical protein